MNSRLKDLAALEPYPAARPPEKGKPNANQLGGYQLKLTALQALPANKPHRNKSCLGVGSR